MVMLFLTALPDPSRLHPLIVHLPIGLILFVGVLEVLRHRKPVYKEAVGLALSLAAAGALLSCLSGWGLSQEPGYGGEALEWHRWLGIATAVAMAGGLAAWQIGQVWSERLYQALLATAVVLVGATGHFGGVMTHGADFLFPGPAGTGPGLQYNLTEASFFEGYIQPLLDQKCVSCHKPSKKKGGLDLSSFSAIQAGGESGALWGQGKEDLILARIHLPLQDEAHMPPEGKLQLEEKEIALLKWWVEAGACSSCTAAEMEATAEVKPHLEELLAPNPYAFANALPALSEDAAAQIEALGFQAEQVADGLPLLRVSAARDSSLGEQQLEALSAWGEHIIGLDLSWTPFRELAGLSRFPNLEKLQLQGTPVSDADLAGLPPLPRLSSLNLYQTRITDQGLEALSKQPGLEKVYLWSTAVTAEGRSKAQALAPDVSWVLDPARSLFGKGKLNPPVVHTASTLFTERAVAVLTSNLKGAEACIQQLPDTAWRCLPVGDSVVLHRSTVVRALLQKEGWERSDTIVARFVKAGATVKQAVLLDEPSGKYGANGARSLTDLVKGGNTFTDGNWLGYEGQHFTTVLELDEATEVHTLTLSALSNPSSWIFFPSGARVWSSMDGEQYTKAGEVRWPARDIEVAGSEMGYFDVKIAPVRAKFIRLEVLSPLKNPDWHPGRGGKSWIFVDEALVNTDTGQRSL